MFIIEATQVDGTKGVYTGRAGQGFVDSNRAEAFTYQSLEGARRQAANLNRMTEIHGWRFMVPTSDAG